MKRLLDRFWPGLGLLALWLLLFWRYLAPDPYRVMYPGGDFTDQFFVFRDIAYRALAAGRLPLWADCFFAGYPFHADPQSQLFYPPIWLSFGLLRLMGWGNFPLFALTLEAILHYLAASIFTYLFLKHELSGPGPAGDANRAAAFLGAITFAYGGFLTGYPPRQTGILETATWMPLALLALRHLADVPGTPFLTSGAIAGATRPHPATPLARSAGRGRAPSGAGGRPSLRALALCALVLAVAFFAGHPQTFLYLMYVALAYFAFRARTQGRRWRWILACLGLLLALLAGLAAVQLLPQARFLLSSNRAGLSFAESAGGFPVGIVVQFFITEAVWSPLYVGIVPLALAVIAVVCSARDRNAGVVFWLAVAGVSLLFSLGANAPFYALAYYGLPGFRLFRGQERLAFAVSFALAALAAFGAQVLSGPLSRRARQAVRLGAGLMVVLWGGAAWAAYRPDLASWAGRMVIALTGLGFAVVVIAARLWGARGWRPLARWMAVGLTAANLALAATPTNAVAPFDPFPYAAILDAIRADPDSFFRVQFDSTNPASWPGHAGCGYGMKEWGGISPIRPAAWVAFEARAPESLRWKLMGIKYLVTWKNGAITREDELPPAERVAEGPTPIGDPSSTAKVYRMFELPRRAWLVYQAQTVRDEAGLFEALKAPGFDPFTTAILPASSAAVALESAGLPPDPGSVVVLDDQPGRLSLRVTAARAGLLVVSEAYDAGWTAEVDGQTVPVVEADGFVQAVPVPAGDSSVRLEYRPGLLAAGAALSLLALAACGLLIVWTRG